MENNYDVNVKEVEKYSVVKKVLLVGSSILYVNFEPDRKCYTFVTNEPSCPCVQYYGVFKDNVFNHP